MKNPSSGRIFDRVKALEKVDLHLNSRRFCLLNLFTHLCSYFPMAFDWLLPLLHGPLELIEPQCFRVVFDPF